ncbi:MAG TPA: 3-hydroxyacyl-CoA dehydrogenase family protein [Chitinophagaceae bacterium]
MKIAVRATEKQKAEWLSKATAGNIEISWVTTDIPAADAYFDLLFEEMDPLFAAVQDRPVFVSGVLTTLQQLPPNVSRINAWNGFIARDTIEVVLREGASAILEALGWKYREVPDVPGMIAARAISMIISEAYFAWGEGVSSKEDIDTAMKLGTNYPYGPFEWSEKIGLHLFYRLLRCLAATDERYQPAPAMEQELKAIA